MRAIWKGAITFGLSAVRNVGTALVALIGRQYDVTEGVDGPGREGGDPAERVRLVAHAHGWRPQSDTASGDTLTISPARP